MDIFNVANSQGQAVAYYRHSAEDKQENSVSIQRQHARSFAKEHDIKIIHEEADEGESGLLADRPGFSRLFDDWICSNEATGFEYVLVYDVSRWGRFQDQDEAAYYEWRCKKRGKQVIYVSRGFPKEDQKLISHLQTSIERYMAAEYSRQLSEKVWHGCMEVSRQGFSVGGAACYGMSRLLLNEKHEPVRVLKKGEHKQIANERVTFIPVGDETTKVVQEIFDSFTKEDKGAIEIADELNDRGVRAAAGGEWDGEKVLRILRNETYVGRLIYNKTWRRLKQGWRKNDRKEWVVKEGAFPAVVDMEVFEKAQKKLSILFTPRSLSKQYILRKAREKVLNDVRELLRQNGLGSDEVSRVCLELPIVYSLKHHIKGADDFLFFSVDEPMRVFGKMIAVSVDMQHSNQLIEQLLLIPEEAFGVSGTCVLLRGDELYRQSVVSPDGIQDFIVELARLCMQKKLVLSKE